MILKEKKKERKIISEFIKDSHFLSNIVGENFYFELILIKLNS